MKAITFLGIANYAYTTFCFDGQERQTRFFPAAVAQFFTPAEMLICATPTVQAHENLALLLAELGEMGIPCRVLPIPEGHSEADLWAIFDALTDAVETGETVTFDVTHSFRSLPFLSFLAVAYLKAAKNVKVERVLYGAWEARDKETDRSPVFDLTPFVALLDWLAATNRFVDLGDGHALAGLLRQGMPPGIQMGQDLQARQLGQQLRSGAEAIEMVSLALRLARPVESMQAAAHLASTLQQAAPGILQRARPFGVLAEQVVMGYGQFGLEEPAEPAHLAQSLWRQYAMIGWYLKQQHVMQAVTLAREWVVSLLAYKFGANMFDNQVERPGVELALNNGVETRKSGQALRTGPYDGQFEALPQADELVGLWSKLTDLRNDLAHVGMRPGAKSASQLAQKARSLQPELEVLAYSLLPAQTVIVKEALT
jgi:CRISPR-associated DxTHG motif protein